MAFRRTLAERLSGITRITSPSLTNCRISSPCSAAKSAILNGKSPSNQTSSDYSDDGIFRRHIHRRSGEIAPEVKFLPTGMGLMEKLRGMDIGRERIRLDGLIPPKRDEPGMNEQKLSVLDAKKILRVSQIETVKSRLRQVENDCISYKEFLEICGKDCSNSDQGLEFAKMLDQSGSVIVLGNVVYLKPEQVVKAIQRLIPAHSPPSIEDPRMKELQEMEKQKTVIDNKADFLVRRELWCGLGFLVVQTAAFMRLTFWELTWDVMEPICFYVTSMYFMSGYAFFLKTSIEPSFEGFFQSRFSAKQKKLMKLEKFDTERYNELKQACYPNATASPASFSSEIDEIPVRT